VTAVTGRLVVVALAGRGSATGTVPGKGTANLDLTRSAAHRLSDQPPQRLYRSSRRVPSTGPSSLLSPLSQTGHRSGSCPASRRSAKPTTSLCERSTPQSDPPDPVASSTPSGISPGSSRWSHRMCLCPGFHRSRFPYSPGSQLGHRVREVVVVPHGLVRPLSSDAEHLDGSALLTPR
jgi:hypothetical protein